MGSSPDGGARLRFRHGIYFRRTEIDECRITILEAVNLDGAERFVCCVNLLQPVRRWIPALLRKQHAELWGVRVVPSACRGCRPLSEPYQLLTQFITKVAVIHLDSDHSSTSITRALHTKEHGDMMPGIDAAFGRAIDLFHRGSAVDGEQGREPPFVSWWGFSAACRLTQTTATLRSIIELKKNWVQQVHPALSRG